MRDPSRLNAAEFTVASWLGSARVSLALPAFQMRAVLSHDAVTMRDPSGLKAAEFTQWSFVRAARGQSERTVNFSTQQFGPGNLSENVGLCVVELKLPFVKRLVCTVEF